ncbi:hypothetical protein Nepgr_029512 [Nepenthes gracilis]|uniref:Uncharacterized protein n=1 Tax=Nepenthes gracilis TaxID=150966 RepID=A0AAD3TE99_NEPGR|nr:hypothetical protein Nepgr_029512 [Nepenthes gracilis]
MNDGAGRGGGMNYQGGDVERNCGRGGWGGEKGGQGTTNRGGPGGGGPQGRGGAMSAKSSLKMALELAVVLPLAIMGQRNVAYPIMGGWLVEDHGRRIRGSSYSGHDGASQYRHGEVNPEKGARPNATSWEREMASECDWARNTLRKGAPVHGTEG